MGPKFDMALDEPTIDDEEFSMNGYNFIVNRELLRKISNVEIFYQYGISKSGFRVLTNILWKLQYKYEPWAKPLNF